MLSRIKKSFKEYSLRREIEREEFRKKLKGKENKVFVFNIVLYSFMFLFLLFSLIFFVLGPINIASLYFQEIGKNDDVVQVVVDYCNYEKTNLSKVHCVNDFARDNIDYMLTQNIIQPDDLVGGSGDCKSWSNFYLVTLNQMGVRTTPNFDSVDTHTFAIADIGNGYCILDQGNVDCNFLAGNSID